MSLGVCSKGAVPPVSPLGALQRDTDTTFPEPSCIYLSGVSSEGALQIKKSHAKHGKIQSLPMEPHADGRSAYSRVQTGSPGGICR